MNILDIASIVFACTAANHLGLIEAIQLVLKWNELPIVSCVKCFSFWAVFIYCLVSGLGIITSLAISFLCAWASIWLDLFMGIIDKLYLMLYEQIYPTANPADADTQCSSDPVPGMPDGQD